jgi:hypothetical protein
MLPISKRATEFRKFLSPKEPFGSAAGKFMPSKVALWDWGGIWLKVDGCTFKFLIGF